MELAPRTQLGLDGMSQNIQRAWTAHEPHPVALAEPPLKGYSDNKNTKTG